MPVAARTHCMELSDTKENDALGNHSVSERQIQRRTRWFIEIKGSLNKDIPNN
jgi:hypothetical protein